MSSGSSKAPNGRSAKVSIRFTDEPTSPEKVLKMEKQVSLADVNTRSIFNAHSSLADMKPRSPLTSQASVGEMKPRSPLTGDRIIRSPRSEQRQKLDPSRITTLSEFLNLDDLILLQGALVDREEDSTNPVSIDEFVRIFRHNLKKLKTDEELSRLFCKIDSNSDGFVDWQELVNYFLVEKEHMIGTPPELQGQKLYDNPIFPDPESAKLYHKAPIDRIIQLQSEAGMSSSDRYVTISRDGFIRTWHHHTLKYRNSVDNWRVWDTPIAHAISKSVQPPSIPFSITTSCAPYITDVCYLRPMNKLAIVSMDRSLSFYDPFSLEPLHRIRELPNNCMTIDCYRKGEKTVIFFGDDHGYIHFAPIQHIPALNKNSFRKQRIHSDWITKARYIPKLDQILTSSLDAKMTLCDTDMEVVRTFEGSQKGIYTFEWSLSNKLVASCGFDRLVYLWNPYLSSPVNIIKSNGAPIINLAFNEDDKQLITLSSEKELKIWDIRTYRCLQLIQLQTAFPCDERINSLIYDPYHKGVVLGSLRLTLIKKVEDKSNIVRSHLHPIVSILYSIPFHQLLTVDNEGNICIWDPDTGLKIFQYHESRGGKTNTVIFHKTERRILISGSDGRVKSWNFNNGVLQKEYVTKADTDITSVLHRFEAISKMIIGVTLNQKILVWYDLEDEPGASQPFKQYVCPGTASVLAADYHPPNNLVLGCSDGDVYLMNIDSGFVRHRFSPKDWIIQKPGKVAIESILFFSIEKILYILCSGMDGILRIWAALSGDLIREVDGNHTKGDAIMTMKFDADFQRLITGDTHGCIKVWKFDCKSVDINWNNRIAPLYHWKAHEYAITSIEIIKTNGHIATSSSDLRVSLWTFDGNTSMIHETTTKPFQSEIDYIDKGRIPKLIFSSNHSNILCLPYTNSR
eukprot:TRINITY_DN5402_c0_g1_i5.p1 TRINITY_DN5402_c0_g1~~TRINITY_DN5402_c0_g1_i5.p1  ORF type:complete len:910 (-),score=139.08 TRINITY_DN5402_c0_g1_i5:1039-3768(-)